MRKFNDNECWINVYDKELYPNSHVGKPIYIYQQAKHISNYMLANGIKTLYRIHVRIKDEIVANSCNSDYTYNGGSSFNS